MCPSFAGMGFFRLAAKDYILLDKSVPRPSEGSKLYIDLEFILHQ
jgi:hypothetical protein